MGLAMYSFRPKPLGRSRCRAAQNIPQPQILLATQPGRDLGPMAAVGSGGAPADPLNRIVSSVPCVRCTLTDPYAYQRAIRDAEVEILVAAEGDFRATFIVWFVGRQGEAPHHSASGSHPSH